MSATKFHTHTKQIIIIIIIIIITKYSGKYLDLENITQLAAALPESV